VRLLGKAGADGHRLPQDAAEGASQRIDESTPPWCCGPARSPAGCPKSAAFTAAADRSGVHVDLVTSVCAGVHTARVHPADPAAARAFITASRTAINALNGTVTLRQRAPEVDRGLDCWGPRPAAVAVLRHVNNQFDPDNRCDPGRFAPWF
jgi:glycolate oxidase FAD binding subunit